MVKLPIFLCNTKSYIAWQNKGIFFVGNHLAVNIISIDSLNFQRTFNWSEISIFLSFHRFSQQLESSSSPLIISPSKIILFICLAQDHVGD